VSDITQRLTEMVGLARLQKKAIRFISITSMDFVALTKRVPVDGDMGAFLGLPLRLGAKTEVRTRKEPTNI